MISLTVLSLDGGLLAACLNAASIALVDAGVPMPSILAACSAGIIPSDDMTSGKRPEPILDLNNAEEVELPFLTVGIVRGKMGEEDGVSVLMMETRVQGAELVETMLRVVMDGCASVRATLEEVVRKHGTKVMQARR